jgi:Raf kinase inhibitor-like YbhB/YbcL family protein
MRRLALIVLAGLAGCGGGGEAKGPAPKAPERIALTSPAFRDGGHIPRRFTCDGVGTSPPLRFGHLPPGSRELVLLMEDPDAPGGTFVHWIVAGLPGRTVGFPEGRVPPAAMQLQQSFGKRGYGPPCPPQGNPPHHYEFTLYAFDHKTGLNPADSADQVRSKLAGATARGRLRASYGR